MPELESERSAKRPGAPRAGAPRSRLAARVDRILSAAIAGEPHVALSIKAPELIADFGPVSDAIAALFERAGPGVMAHWRVAQALKPSGLEGELLNLLVDPDPKVRTAAARLCGALRMSDSLPWLADLLEDPKPKVRDAAVRALGDLGGHGAVDALMAAVDRIPQHRLAIELAHAASDMDIEALMRKPASVEAAVVTVLACGLRHDRIKIGPLLGIAHDRRWPSRVRVAACRALAMIHDADAADRLRDLFGDPDAGVRAAAARTQRRCRPAGRQG